MSGETEMVTPRIPERHGQGLRASAGQVRPARNTPKKTLAVKAKKVEAFKHIAAKTAHRPSPDRKATEKDVRQMLGKVDSAGVARILRLEPTFAELEEAVMWSRGEAYLLGRRPLMGITAMVFEIITAKASD
jgi:hypothetical protein